MRKIARPRGRYHGVMPAPALAPADRARGALLGLAAGRARAAVAAGGAPPDQPGGEPLLAALLGEALLQPQPDFERLMTAWAAEARRQPTALGAWTREALGFFDAYHAPPPPEVVDGRADAALLPRLVPVALRFAGSPRHLLSATWHAALLTHADPVAAWGAAAVNVAVARFVAGWRDFVLDVIEALRNNESPLPLLDALRRLPLVRAGEVDAAVRGLPAAGATAVRALWLAYHEPRPDHALDAAAGDADLAMTVGALVGARNGDAALPVEWRAVIPAADGLAEMAELLLEASGVAPGA